MKFTKAQTKMKNNFTTQSKACKEAILIISDAYNGKDFAFTPEFLDQLECAAQTLAALNLTRDLVDKGREEYWEKMYESFDVFVAGTIEQENEHKEKLLSMSYDEIAKAHSRIKDLEGVLGEIIENENQNSFFMEGYKNGSASISEVMAAGDDLNKSLQKGFSLLKQQ